MRFKTILYFSLSGVYKRIGIKSSLVHIISLGLITLLILTVSGISFGVLDYQKKFLHKNNQWVSVVYITSKSEGKSHFQITNKQLKYLKQKEQKSQVILSLSPYQRGGLDFKGVQDIVTVYSFPPEDHIIRNLKLASGRRFLAEDKGKVGLLLSENFVKFTLGLDQPFPNKIPVIFPSDGFNTFEVQVPIQGVFRSEEIPGLGKIDVIVPQDFLSRYRDYDPYWVYREMGTDDVALIRDKDIVREVMVTGIPTPAAKFVQQHISEIFGKRAQATQYGNQVVVHLNAFIDPKQFATDQQFFADTVRDMLLASPLFLGKEVELAPKVAINKKMKISEQATHPFLSSPSPNYEAVILLAKDISTVLPLVEEINKNDAKLQAIAPFKKSIEEFLRIKEFLGMAVPSIIAILSVIGVITILFTSYAHFFRKAQEIGLLKTLGASRSNILLIYLIQAVVLNIAAVFLAGIIFWMTQNSLNTVFPQFFPIPESYKLIILPYGAAILSIIGAIVLASLVSLISVNSAIKTDPAKVLRSQINV